MTLRILSNILVVGASLVTVAHGSTGGWPDGGWHGKVTKASSRSLEGGPPAKRRCVQGFGAADGGPSALGGHRRPAGPDDGGPPAQRRCVQGPGAAHLSNGASEELYRLLRALDGSGLASSSPVAPVVPVSLAQRPASGSAKEFHMSWSIPNVVPSGQLPTSPAQLSPFSALGTSNGTGQSFLSAAPQQSSTDFLGPLVGVYGDSDAGAAAQQSSDQDEAATADRPDGLRREHHNYLERERQKRLAEVFAKYEKNSHVQAYLERLQQPHNSLRAAFYILNPEGDWKNASIRQRLDTARDRLRSELLKTDQKTIGLLTDDHVKNITDGLNGLEYNLDDIGLYSDLLKQYAAQNPQETDFQLIGHVINSGLFSLEALVDLKILKDEEVAQAQTEAERLKQEAEREKAEQEQKKAEREQRKAEREQKKAEQEQKKAEREQRKAEREQRLKEASERKTAERNQKKAERAQERAQRAKEKAEREQEKPILSSKVRAERQYLQAVEIVIGFVGSAYKSLTVTGFIAQSSFYSTINHSRTGMSKILDTKAQEKGIPLTDEEMATYMQENPAWRSLQFTPAHKILWINLVNKQANAENKRDGLVRLLAAGVFTVADLAVAGIPFDAAEKKAAVDFLIECKEPLTQKIAGINFLAAGVFSREELAAAGINLTDAEVAQAEKVRLEVINVPAVATQLPAQELFVGQSRGGRHEQSQAVKERVDFYQSNAMIRHYLTHMERQREELKKACTLLVPGMKEKMEDPEDRISNFLADYQARGVPLTDPNVRDALAQRRDLGKIKFTQSAPRVFLEAFKNPDIEQQIKARALPHVLASGVLTDKDLRAQGISVPALASGQWHASGPLGQDVGGSFGAPGSQYPMAWPVRPNTFGDLLGAAGQPTTSAAQLTAFSDLLGAAGQPLPFGGAGQQAAFGALLGVASQPPTFGVAPQLSPFGALGTSNGTGQSFLSAAPQQSSTDFLGPLVGVYGDSDANTPDDADVLTKYQTNRDVQAYLERLKQQRTSLREAYKTLNPEGNWAKAGIMWRFKTAKNKLISELKKGQKTIGLLSDANVESITKRLNGLQYTDNDRELFSPLLTSYGTQNRSSANFQTLIRHVINSGLFSLEALVELKILTDAEVAQAQTAAERLKEEQQTRLEATTAAAPVSLAQGPVSDPAQRGNEDLDDFFGAAPQPPTSAAQLAPFDALFGAAAQPTTSAAQPPAFGALLGVAAQPPALGAAPQLSPFGALGTSNGTGQPILPAAPQQSSTDFLGPLVRPDGDWDDLLGAAPQLSPFGALGTSNGTGQPILPAAPQQSSTVFPGPLVGLYGDSDAGAAAQQSSDQDEAATAARPGKLRRQHHTDQRRERRPKCLQILEEYQTNPHVQAYLERLQQQHNSLFEAYTILNPKGKWVKEPIRQRLDTAKRKLGSEFNKQQKTIGLLSDANVESITKRLKGLNYIDTDRNLFSSLLTKYAKQDPQKTDFQTAIGHVINSGLFSLEDLVGLNILKDAEVAQAQTAAERLKEEQQTRLEAIEKPAVSPPQSALGAPLVLAAVPAPAPQVFRLNHLRRNPKANKRNKKANKDQRRKAKIIDALERYKSNVTLEEYLGQLQQQHGSLWEAYNILNPNGDWKNASIRQRRQTARLKIGTELKNLEEKGFDMSDPNLTPFLQGKPDLGVISFNDDDREFCINLLKGFRGEDSDKKSAAINFLAAGVLSREELRTLRIHLTDAEVAQAEKARLEATTAAAPVSLAQGPVSDPAQTGSWGLGDLFGDDPQLPSFDAPSTSNGTGQPILPDALQQSSTDFLGPLVGPYGDSDAGAAAPQSSDEDEAATAANNLRRQRCSHVEMKRRKKLRQALEQYEKNPAVQAYLERLQQQYESLKAAFYILNPHGAWEKASIRQRLDTAKDRLGSELLKKDPKTIGLLSDAHVENITEGLKGLNYNEKDIKLYSNLLKQYAAENPQETNFQLIGHVINSGLLSLEALVDLKILKDEEVAQAEKARKARLEATTAAAPVSLAQSPVSGPRQTGSWVLGDLFGDASQPTAFSDFLGGLSDATHNAFGAAAQPTTFGDLLGAAPQPLPFGGPPQLSPFGDLFGDASQPPAFGALLGAASQPTTSAPQPPAFGAASQSCHMAWPIPKTFGGSFGVASQPPASAAQPPASAAQPPASAAQPPTSAAQPLPFGAAGQDSSAEADALFRELESLIGS